MSASLWNVVSSFLLPCKAGTGIRLSGSSSGYVGLKPAAAAGSTDFTLPSADGTSGQAWVTNGSGVISFASFATSSDLTTAIGTAALKANNLSDLASASTARTNLGLGTAAVEAIGTSGANVPLLNGANTWSGANTFSLNGSASTSAVNYSGTPFAGTGITSFPLLYLNESGATASTVLSTSGTFIGVNGSGNADLMHLMKNGASRLQVTTAGAMTLQSTLTMTTGNLVMVSSSAMMRWSGSTIMTASSNGLFQLTNSAQTGFTRLILGPNSTSGAGIATSGTTVTHTLGDGTGWSTNQLRIQPRVGSTTSSATPTINTDNVDEYYLTAQAADITSMTTNLSGTPNNGQSLFISITGTAARAITWGSSFESGPATLPTTTTTTQRLDVFFKWNSGSSKWRCMAQGSA